MTAHFYIVGETGSGRAPVQGALCRWCPHCGRKFGKTVAEPPDRCPECHREIVYAGWRYTGPPSYPLPDVDFGEGAVMGHVPESLADVHRYAWDETRAAALVVAVFLAWTAVAVGLGYHFGFTAGKRDAIAKLEAIGVMR